MTPEDLQYLQHMEQRLMAAIKKVETTLLTEFHKWAGPLDQRMRSHREAIRTLDLEGEQTSDTLRQIEARLKELGKK